MSEAPTEVELFFEARAALSRRFPYLSWSILGISGIALALLLFFSTDTAVFLRTALPLSCALLFVPFGIRMGRSVVRAWWPDLENFVIDPKEHLLGWYNQETRVFAGTVAMIAAGVLMCVVAVGAFTLGGAFVGLGVANRVALACFISLGGFVAGVGLCNVFYLSRLIWRLGVFRIKVTSHPFGVLTTGRALLRCFFIAGAIWCAFASSATVGLPAGWIPMATLALPTVLFFITAFIVCQVPIHNRMVQFKRSEILDLERMLESLAPKNAPELTEERREQIQFYEKRLSYTVGLPEWPFGWKTLLGAALSGMISALPTIIEFSIQAIQSLRHTAA